MKHWAGHRTHLVWFQDQAWFACHQEEGTGSQLLPIVSLNESEQRTLKPKKNFKSKKEMKSQQGYVKDRPVGTFFNLGSCENEYCVLAMQTNNNLLVAGHAANTQQIKRTAIRTGKIAVALPGICFNLLFGEIAKLYAVRSVNVLGNSGNLLFNGEVQVIKEFELGFALASSDQSFRELPCTSATFSPVITDNGGIRATGQCFLSD